MTLLLTHHNVALIFIIDISDIVSNYLFAFIGYG